MIKMILALACLLTLAVFPGGLSAEESGSLLEVSGSILSETGCVGLVDSIPDGAARDWYSATSASARLSREAEQTRFFAALWTQYDGGEGNWELSLDEAWADWRPASFLALRLGRSRLQFGPCVAFNPANALVPKDGFDSRANKTGLDGFSLELQPLLLAERGRALPYSLTVNAAFVLPRAAGSPAAAVSSSSGGADAIPAKPFDLDESGAVGRASLILPGLGLIGLTELGVSGDFRRIGGAAPGGKIPVAGGAWLSTDVAGFVLGAEGTVRTPDFGTLSECGSVAPAVPADDNEYGYAFSLNRRKGDWFAVI